MDKIVSAISQNKEVICYAIRSTDLVSRAERIHKSSAVVTAALGRLLTAASIMGATLPNDDQSVTLYVKGDGPIGLVLAVGEPDGSVRGYVGKTVVELEPTSDGKLDVGSAVGKNGILQVTKDLGGFSKEPFVGSVPLVSGEIAEDITSYFANSEQIPTVCALGVLVNPDLSVAQAGGFIAQLLPGASEESIAQLEKNLETLPSITALMCDGKTPEDILSLVLDGLEPKILEEKPVEYRCDCSRERVERALISLGKDELLSLSSEKSIEMDCHFCPKLYRFSSQELLELAGNL